MISTTPTAPGRLPIISAERTAAVRAALSRTEPYDLSNAVISHVRRRAAARHPGLPTIEEAGRTLSHAALVARVGAAAAALAARGVLAGQVVAVGGEPGGDVLTAFLALETLGAVYLPVDPAWPGRPARRITDVLADSGAVTATDLKHNWATSDDVQSDGSRTAPAEIGWRHTVIPAEPPGPVLNGSTPRARLLIAQLADAYLYWRLELDAFAAVLRGRSSRLTPRPCTESTVPPATRITAPDGYTDRRLRPMQPDTKNTGATGPESSFVSHFAAQVAEGPDDPALIHGDRVVTYQELDLWSGRLAALLSARGVGLGSLVALAAERGRPAATAGVLAVLKAGAGYLGLDPAIPAHRQGLMVQETEPDCLLAEPGLDQFPTLTAPRVMLEPVADGPVLAGPSTGEAVAEASTVFHVVYTSGTTGDPKGVRVSYAAVLNRLAWMWRDYPFPPGAVVASHKSIALVATPWEMLGGLLQGVPSVVLDRDEVLDPAQFADAIERRRITHLFLTPHLIGGLLDEVERRGGLTHQPVFVTSGADALPVDTALRFRRAFPATTLLNLYGMSETSSIVAAYNTAALSPDASRVPAGTPVAGASISVLDPSARELPPGAVGEVWVSGLPVALGYVNDRGADRFVTAADGTVSYRTGDHGRFLPTGDLEIAGRVDNQVKIRGYRVELEEVEATLRAAASVTGAVVYVDEDSGEPKLVGCVTTADETDPAALRAFVRDRLPDYMVPAEVVVFPDLPLGPNGKLDRAELNTQLAKIRQKVRAGFAPADDTEATVTGIWAELLGSAPTDRADNFFEAGGHSLLAVRFINRLEHAIGLRLTPRQFFRSPTFAGIVERCRPAVERGSAS